jgi:hypothetical protein
MRVLRQSIASAGAALVTALTDNFKLSLAGGAGGTDGDNSAS